MVLAHDEQSFLPENMLFGFAFLSFTPEKLQSYSLHSAAVTVEHLKPFTIWVYSLKILFIRQV